MFFHIELAIFQSSQILTQLPFNKGYFGMFIHTTAHLTQTPMPYKCTTSSKIWFGIPKTVVKTYLAKLSLCTQIHCT